MQIGWVESPPYFCVATETVRDVTLDYCDTPIGSLPCHKFTVNVAGNKAFEELPVTSTTATTFLHALEVYVDFMSIIIPTSWEQLEHVATAVMTGIHEVFPADLVASNNPISEKKL
jgi:hypothetical protein